MKYAASSVQGGAAKHAGNQKSEGRRRLRHGGSAANPGRAEECAAPHCMKTIVPTIDGA